MGWFKNKITEKKKETIILPYFEDTIHLVQISKDLSFKDCIKSDDSGFSDLKEALYKCYEIYTSPSSPYVFMIDETNNKLLKNNIIAFYFPDCEDNSSRYYKNNTKNGTFTVESLRI